MAGAQALGASRHRTQIPVLQALLQEAKPAVRCMGAAAVLRLSRGAPPRIPWPLRHYASSAGARPRVPEIFSIINKEIP
jgi:hypothetical protein